MNRNILILLLSVSVGIITWIIAGFNYSSSNSNMIYSLPHLFMELVVILAALFLIIEAQIKEPSYNRYTRILIGYSIITVHLSVIILGGY